MSEKLETISEWGAFVSIWLIGNGLCIGASIDASPWFLVGIIPFNFIGLSIYATLRDKGK